ncbi:MAG: hypothetical protein ABI548_25520 [Polyangiaceae bacterium]
MFGRTRWVISAAVTGGALASACGGSVASDREGHPGGGTSTVGGSEGTVVTSPGVSEIAGAGGFGFATSGSGGYPTPTPAGQPVCPASVPVDGSSCSAGNGAPGHSKCNYPDGCGG